MTDEVFRAMKGVSDLNGQLLIWQSFGFCSAGGSDAYRQNAVRSTLDFLPWKTFHRIVDRCDGDRYVKSLTCTEQFRVMSFAQLTYRESLRDIEVCLSAQSIRRQL